MNSNSSFCREMVQKALKYFAFHNGVFFFFFFLIRLVSFSPGWCDSVLSCVVMNDSSAIVAVHLWWTWEGLFRVSGHVSGSCLAIPVSLPPVLPPLGICQSSRRVFTEASGTPCSVWDPQAAILNAVFLTPWDQVGRKCILY